MTYFRLILFVVLLSSLDAKNRNGGGGCEAGNFRNIESAPQDALIYGLTQDCQMFFIRPSQLHLLSTIRVDKRHSFCYANLIQLHVKAHDTLLLTFKQANNRICTLDVHIPALSMLFGDHLFRYSLLNSLPYASCSHSKDHSFQLEPDLSFLDPVYNDVIYFIDALSSGSEWKVLQFLIKDTGNLNMMNNLTIMSKDAAANEFVVSLDNQRDKVYRRNRFDNFISQQCAFEMLFRPKESEVDSFQTPSRGYGTVLNGQSVDGDAMVYTETDRTTDPPTSRLHILSIQFPEKVECISATSFAFEVGIIRESTMKSLKNDPRPPFGTKISPKPPSPSKPVKPTKKTSTTSTVAPTTSTATSRPTTHSTSSKPKGAYSPSKSFFSYEGIGTTTSSTSEAVLISNEIPVEEIEKEQEEEEEEELNEIIKELRSDEEEDTSKAVGELRTRVRDVNVTTSGVGGPSNETLTDAEAVKGSGRRRIRADFVVYPLIFYLNFYFFT